MDDDAAAAWEDRITRLMQLGQRLRLLEAYVGVLEERLAEYEPAERQRPQLHLVE